MLDSVGHESTPETYSSRTGDERQAQFLLKKLIVMATVN